MYWEYWFKRIKAADQYSAKIGARKQGYLILTLYIVDAQIC